MAEHLAEANGVLSGATSIALHSRSLLKVGRHRLIEILSTTTTLVFNTRALVTIIGDKKLFTAELRGSPGRVH